MVVNNKPSVARVNHFEALLYKNHIGLVKMFGTNKHERLEGFNFLKDQVLNIKVAYEGNDRIWEM